ncbi:MAG: O-antigen ligase family protein [Anaerolineae bacterium]
MLQDIKLIYKIVLIAEGLILGGITVAFWYPIDPSLGLRDAWFWLLWLAVPIFALRLRLTGRIWTRTPLHDWLIAFVLWGVFSYSQAWLQRESLLAPMGRPLLGIWTYIYFVELTRATRHLMPALMLFVGMGTSLSVIALVSSQWLEEKSRLLWGIISRLPRFDYRTFANSLDGQVCGAWVDLVHREACFNPSDLMQWSFLSFNVNEIGGALAWIVPAMIGLAMGAPSRTDEPNQGMGWQILRGVSGVAGTIGLLALIFGQSRFAIAGVMLSLALISWFSLRSWRWRGVAFGGLALLLLVQISVMFGLAQPQSAGLSDRDAESVITRQAIWQRSAEMMRDYPLAGVGMYMYRTAIQQEAYLIPYYVENDLPMPPHAHNEWLHIGAEMGVIGLLLFIGMQVTTAWMIWQGWHYGDQLSRTVALAMGAGLLAHAVYGVGDTIALWDRLQFVLWWLIGLIGAQYTLARYHRTASERDLTPSITDS